MKFRVIFVYFLFLVSAVQSLAVPARKGIFTYTQPDGTTFQASLSGDEFGRVLTTADGCVVTMGKDGFYCYASLSPAGRIVNSGVHVSAEGSGSTAAAASRTVKLNDIRRLNIQRRLSAEKFRAASASIVTKASPVKKKNVIILAQFPNLDFKYSRSNFVNLLTGQGDSAMKYFNDQFGGAYEFEFIISSVVTLSREYAYYGANDDQGLDIRPAELVAEACRLAAAEVDFSRCDGDNDGEVDNVFVFVAGLSEAEDAGENYIWPHQWSVEEAGIRLSIDGKKINSYAIATEQCRDENWNWGFATIGTFCHEYSHTLGLMDHYDTDESDSGGEADCMWGTTDLMDHGNYNNSGKTPPNYNAPELELFGIGTQEYLETGNYSLSPVGAEKRYLRMDTDKPGEYFLFECREASGWDKYIGGSGMLIYHVDRSGNNAGYSDQERRVLTAQERWSFNEVNCRPDHQCLDIVEAIPIAKDAAQAFWPNGTHTAFTPATKPSFKFWSGNSPDISLIDIKKTGSGVTFTAAGPLSLEKLEEFQDAAIVLWTCTDISSESKISIKDPAGNTVTHIVEPYDDGRYSYTFEGLKPKSTYKVTISSMADSGTFITTEFTTKAYYTDGYPFIYLNSAQRNPDGSFVAGTSMPLRVFNAQDAARVSWSFNSKVLTDNGSGYYTVVGSGTIKATIDYKDGTREIISKTITVK